MTCDELHLLRDPYLDSELDARTTIEAEAHLKSCPECARLFAEAQRLEARIEATLNQGPRTAAVWERIEQAVVAKPALRPHFETSWLTVLQQQLTGSLRHSRLAWAGLGAAWMAILALNSSAQEAEAPLIVGQRLPSSSQMRFAWQQKRLLMAELTVASEPLPAGKPKAAPPSPHSQRPNETPNA
jgi:anti-sigma factor RsiW